MATPPELDGTLNGSRPTVVDCLAHVHSADFSNVELAKHLCRFAADGLRFFCNKKSFDVYHEYVFVPTRGASEELEVNALSIARLDAEIKAFVKFFTEGEACGRKIEKKYADPCPLNLLHSSNQTIVKLRNAFRQMADKELGIYEKEINVDAGIGSRILNMY